MITEYTKKHTKDIRINLSFVDRAESLCNILATTVGQ